MPVTVLLAIFVASWTTGPPGTGAGAPGDDRVGLRVLLTVAGIAGVGLASASVGGLLARRLSGRGVAPGDRRRVVRAGRGLDILALLAFGAVVHGAGWSRVVADGLGLRGSLVLDEALMFLPFVLMQLAVWVGLAPAERALARRGRGGAAPRGAPGMLVMKARQTFGLVLPVALLFALVQDLDARYRPAEALGSWSLVALYGGLGVLILVLSPAFVRLSWPARPMPPGPLRDRLERLARRFGFRFSDILVWDTGGAVVNAGVTGALPRFRYVLISDAMVEKLAPREIEAVFGHELGHVAHRHLAFFGVFFLGSLGVMALLGRGIDRFLAVGSPFWVLGGNEAVELAVQATVLLGVVASYFLLVFGPLSRRFERQADVFGCRAVSCGLPECPPHPDVNARDDWSGRPEAPCPVGIGIFVEALMSVALHNGMEPRALSWRHGSIARRVLFLRNLEGRPEAVRRFQLRVVGFRVALTGALLAALLAALETGALEELAGASTLGGAELPIPGVTAPPRPVDRSM